MCYIFPESFLFGKYRTPLRNPLRPSRATLALCCLRGCMLCSQFAFICFVCAGERDLIALHITLSLSSYFLLGPHVLYHYVHLIKIINPEDISWNINQSSKV